MILSRQCRRYIWKNTLSHTIHTQSSSEWLLNTSNLQRDQVRQARLTWEEKNPSCLPPNWSTRVKEWQTEFNVSMEDNLYLRCALTSPHSSLRLPNEECPRISNPAYETLGDSVLDFLALHFVFMKCPTAQQGELSKTRMEYVHNTVLAQRAMQLKIEPLILGLSQIDNGAGQRDVITGTVDAIIGAIFLEQGLPAASDFCMQYIFLEDGIKHEGHYVNELQEAVSAKIKILPVYRKHNTVGKVSVIVNHQIWATARGGTYREGKQLAAKKAFEQLSTRFKH